MTQAMIVSFGGAPEPVAKAIAEHQPQFICFLASRDSQDKIGEVRQLLAQGGLPLPESRVVLADNADDLVLCYETALECARLLEERQIAAERVVVDYTGGTKSMTAALALATVGKGYRFSYVGGTKRTKKGLGIVEDGFEVVSTSLDPWQLFAVAEWQRLVLHVDQYQYEAALCLVREIGPRQPHERLRWQGLASVLEGLLFWDRFSHQQALPLMLQGLKDLEKWDETVVEDRVITEFVRQTQECYRFLSELDRETGHFQYPAHRLMVDLLANAERRAEQGRYDDATLRLYRALELQGQVALWEGHRISTSDVPEDLIPLEHQNEFLEKYRDRDGTIKLPLEASFRLLNAFNHPVGKKFIKHRGEFGRILNSRNQSILAHGLEPVDGSSYHSFMHLLRQTFHLHDSIAFPRLHSPF